MNIDERAEELESIYGVSKEATLKVLSALHPEDATRATIAKFATEYIMSSMFPNLSAAFDAYQQSKEQEDAQEYAANAARFPALHATQPQMLAMQQNAMFGGGMPMGGAPPVHHRRHRRHHG